MNIYPVITAVAACFYLSLGLYILLINFKLGINRLFFLICLSLSIWTFFASFMYNAENIRILLILYPISCLGFHFYFAFNLHFCIKLTKIKINYMFYIFLYLIPFVFFMMSIIDHRVFVNFVMKNNKWLFLYRRYSVWVYLYLTYQSATIILSVVFLLKWKSKIKSKKVKRISDILITTNLISYPFAVLMTLILRFLFQYRPQGETPLYFIIWIIVSFYIVSKYYFLSLTPELISGYLVSNINESILLLDSDLKIFFINKKTEEITGKIKNEIINKDLSDIVLKSELIKNEIDKMLKNQYNDFSCRLYFKGITGPALMDLKISRVHDRFNDLLGILIIGSEVKGMKQLKLFFKLSDREIEIVQLLMEGLTGKKIGTIIHLTENTVKTHIKNIFKKLKVNGRIEMINLLSEFDLIPRSFSKKKILID